MFFCACCISPFIFIISVIVVLLIDHNDPSNKPANDGDKEEL